MSGGAASARVLHLTDTEALTDLATYVGRARALDADGAVRLQAHGRALAAYVGVLPGSGLMGQGSTVGLRVFALAQDASLDTTVALAAMGDRLARLTGRPTDGGGGVLPAPDDGELPPPSAGAAAAPLDVPPVAVHSGWAALTPPRGGWSAVGRLPVPLLLDVARQGVAEIAEGAGDGAGGPAVAALRETVWGRPVVAAAMQGVTLPAGAAFAAYALGFFPAAGGEAELRRSGRWLRLTTPAGHVLVR